MSVQVKEDTQAYHCYKTPTVEENYYCNFGINPEVIDKLDHPDLLFPGVDQDGEIHIIELKNHDYFIATLFVPQTRSSLSEPHPLIHGFITAAIRPSKETLDLVCVTRIKILFKKLPICSLIFLNSIEQFQESVF
ncbi:hypothetical protein [Paenibacillus sp. NPDC057934]|uniref:hypothetical protein n=1 Tax=Paenibacillus sp. NPDC057934 TaxID=3346282 RepID=UPI0036DD8ECF